MEKVNFYNRKHQRCGYIGLENSADGAKLYFYGDIVSSDWAKWGDDDTCPSDISKLLNSIDSEVPLEIYFNSGGGDAFAGLAIYNTLMRHKGKKTGTVDGLAASIASAILMACDEVKVSTGAQVMVHKPWCFTWGNADEMRKTIEQLDKCQESIVDAYMTKVKEGVSREDIEALVNAETWMNGEDFAKYFDCSVNGGAAVAACASAYFGKYRNTPRELLESAERGESERERENAEKAKADIVDDLFMYGA